jgi:hypothetical protein
MRSGFPATLLPINPDKGLANAPIQAKNVSKEEWYQSAWTVIFKALIRWKIITSSEEKRGNICE